ncbi:UDP-glycosyltransferase 73C6-like [Durio zibethinus]|uniref:Glycosyltransferase n=1 Tax=Durio zibethinus TaxID=66656 RepID=A0A6P6AMU0_DURZI|nr:UDP-glycosyltransferase 73C6-like [Durio zibethinus]
MGSLSDQLHFVLFPFMAQGHLIPMVDIGRLLAQRDVIVTIVTTPHNAGRVHKSVARAIESGHPIRLVQLRFPGKEVGFPDGCENVDMLSSKEDFFKFFIAANMMEEAAQKLFEKLTPRPNCIISDMCLYYTSKIASKFQVPRISFHGFCCFCLFCLHNINSSKILDSITSDSEYFTVPGLPDKVEFTKVQLPLNYDETWKEIFEPMAEADQASYGVVINTFAELESSYVKEYRKVRKDKAWSIGPVSLSHKDELDKAQRGNKASINEQQCMKWLDSQEPSSVIYACLGSISSLKPPQLIELGLGLEASNKPFIWVLRGNETSKEVEKWIKEDGFEERTKARGLVVLGWAPQVLILSHPAIGGFLTHCGWNSTIEGISAGVPLITLPLFADQFSNEKLVVQILKIGVSLGVEKPTVGGEEEKAGYMLKKENIKKAVEKLMDEGNEGSDRRKRAKEYGEKAKKAVEVGGSSYLNMTLLIQDIRQQSHKMCWDLGPTSQSHGEEI